MERADQTFRRDLAGYGLFDAEAETKLNLKIHAVEPFQPITVGPYGVIACPANHDPESGSMLYAITSNRRSIFYGVDTAALFEETWQAFHQYEMRFDLVVLDHAYGPDEQGDDHLSAHQVAEHAKHLWKAGILKDSGRVLATHIAHEGNPVHPKLAAFASQHGYEVAYDGFEVIV